MAFTNIGEMVISDGISDYLFRPSFAAMSRIGDPEEIVKTYAVLNGEIIRQVLPLLNKAIEMASGVSKLQRAMYYQLTGKSAQDWILTALRKPIYFRPVLEAAMNVIEACCEDDPVALIGEWVPGTKGIIYRPGKMPVDQMVMLANALLRHGIIGAVEVKQRGKPEEKQSSSEFDAITYINAAQCHFGMTQAAAEQLTMTQFVMLLRARYPEDKGFTQEEYEAVMDEDERRWQEMIAEEERRKKVAH